MQLTKNFSLAELTKSPVAIKFGIENIPSQYEIENLTALCKNILQPVRDYFDRPVTINSGYRNHILNKKIGGALSSQHVLGEAADVEISGISNDLLWNFIGENLKFDQLIAEYLSPKDGASGWVHVSYSKNNRGEKLSCIKRGVYVSGLHYAQ